MSRRRQIFLVLSCLGVLWVNLARASEIEDYLRLEDPTFSWKVAETKKTELGTVVSIPLVSQTWQGIRWEHGLRVYDVPGTGHPDAMLLFITGGSTTSKPSAEQDGMGFTLAKASGVRVAILPQVPNQPLLGGKTEDTLIAETFVRFLETKDAKWPLLFPMVKSAVKAMDALQAWSKESQHTVPTRFVVTGASKRGWTTWLTGAHDPRVIAIAPMVIDTLNFRAQRKHYLEVWGKPSEEIDDYTKRGLNEVIEKSEGERLWKMVDPYNYLDRLTLPKLLINGSNDPYWTLDALNIYWDELKGPKSVVYLPNAGHDLQAHRDYAIGGIGALVRHSVSGKSLPKLTWKHANDGQNRLRLTVQSSPAPKSARVWVARGETRDFRPVTWKDEAFPEDGEGYKIAIPRPEKGYVALFGDFEYEIDGVPYHLSTQVRQAGATE